MAKGDDIVRRKKNKANRKKLNSKADSSNVSARVAALIAAKKRRRAGKRRICEGMCFSLPTPDDPFNEQHGKNNFKRIERNKAVPLKKDEKVLVKGKSAVLRKGSDSGDNVKEDNLERVNEKLLNSKEELKKLVTSLNNVVQTRPTNPRCADIQPDGTVDVHGHQGQACESSDCPSKYLMLCLKTIENASCQDGTYISAEDKPLFVSTWGVEFWKCYSAGKDVVEASGSSCNVEQIAWIASAAADAISIREKECLSFTHPFLLFLVPSKEKAFKVRSVCKSLKAVGIHTVSLHPGAPLDHQITGLKSCEPEFLVSTPERLLELISLKAIDITGVSLLVIDGMESFCGDGYLDMIKSIRQAISAKPYTMVFNDCFNSASIPAVQNLLTGPVCRLSLNNSIASQSACIIQSVHMCASKEEKLVEGIRALDHAYENQLNQHLKVLFVIAQDANVEALASALKFKGYYISAGSYYNILEVQNSEMGRAASIIDVKHISTTDLGEYTVVIIPDFVLSIENYVQILTRMARRTVNSVLQSFLTKDDAQHAGPLIEILEQCGQAVPDSLRNLHPKK